MIVEPDVGSADYIAHHRRRAAQERERAAACTDPMTQRLHLELAARHEALLRDHDQEHGMLADG